MPEGFTCPEERVKPWGTAHAVLCCKGVVNEPFVVINSDDFYGSGAYSNLANWIEKTDFSGDKYKFAMAGYYLKNTLTDNGTVSRGVCDVDENGQLKDVIERTKIMRVDGKISFTEDGESWTELQKGSTVSMNCWGFSCMMMPELRNRFTAFLDRNTDNMLKCEYFLPFVVDELLKEGVVRDIIRQCQVARKDAGYQVEQRIKAAIIVDDEFIVNALNEKLAYIAGELLADSVVINEEIDNDYSTEFSINDKKIKVSVVKGE